MVPKEFKFKQLISVYLRLVYFLSFFFLIFSLYFLPLVIFVVPFLVIFFGIIFKAIKTKNAFILGKTFTFLFFGLGMIHGLIIYLFGMDKKFGS